MISVSCLKVMLVLLKIDEVQIQAFFPLISFLSFSFKNSGGILQCKLLLVLILLNWIHSIQT